MRTPITFDNDTGEVIEQPNFGGQGYVPPNSGAGAIPGQRGFGPTQKMLDTAPIPDAPWLTPELVEKELSRGECKWES